MGTPAYGSVAEEGGIVVVAAMLPLASNEAEDLVMQNHRDK